MFIAFKYKLALLISGLILLLLGGTFYMVQQNLEDKFIQGIEQDLQKTRLIVAQLMAQRRRAISSSANILQGNPLIREIITDNSMDRETSDDIIAEEILPDFPRLSLLMVTDADGDVISAAGVENKGIAYLQGHPMYGYIMNGRPGLGFLFQGDICIQVVGIPVFLREELIGAIVVGAPLAAKDLARIKAMSDADLALFRQQAVFLASDWGLPNQQGQRAQRLHAVAAQAPPAKRNKAIYRERQRNDSPELMQLDGERWLYAIVRDRRGFLPDYLLATSLDQQLAFVDDIRSDTLAIAAIGLGIALLLTFIFAQGVSRPISRLIRATDAVEQEDFSFRTTINSHDEFSRLGASFNLMLEGLEERESMRGAMNRLMSQSVVDELLEGKIPTEGELRQASLLWISLHGFENATDNASAKNQLAQINDCLTRVAFCIDAGQGVIDSYPNTAILAMFGIPLGIDQAVEKALQTAFDSVEAITLYNLEQQAEGSPTSNIRVSATIVTSQIIAGNLGAEHRSSYSITGNGRDAVQTLAEKANQQGTVIVIDPTSYQMLDTNSQANFTGPFDTEPNTPAYWLAKEFSAKIFSDGKTKP